MMDAVLWALSQSVKVLGIVGAWYLFKAIVGGGSETIRDLIDTAGIGIQAGCFHLKRCLLAKIRKEKEVTEETVKTEGSVQ